uniref:Mitochondrial 54s ribosomal protein 22 n=1 Tax=Candidozyma auris TaxID=498019 RepID=A0A0L0NWN5_CANAR
MFRSLGLLPASSSRLLRISAPRQCLRRFHYTPSPFALGSLFGEITSTKESKEEQNEVEPASESGIPAEDSKLKEFHREEALKKQLRSDKFISPLKRKFYQLNVEQNGFFKNGQIVHDAELGKTYRVTLTNEEIDILEPTVYIQSYRIKSSMKKATIVNRFVRGYDVKTAINQLHFNPKKMATELEKLLKRALVQAKEVGINEDDAYIQALWTGSDGNWRKRPDIKGRGRTGIIEHPYIHLKAIIKGKQTKQRIAWEKEQKQLLAKPKLLLNNEPLNFKVQSQYRW